MDVNPRTIRRQACPYGKMGLTAYKKKLAGFRMLKPNKNPRLITETGIFEYKF
jgi:hypothetical protein